MFSCTFHFGRILSFLLLTLYFTNPLAAQKQFTFEDVMKFEDIKTPVISADGGWAAFGVWPEIGDGEVRVVSTDGNTEYIIERGERPGFTKNGQWAGAFVKQPYIEAKNAGKNAKRRGLTLLQTSDGETKEFERVRRFSFSNNSEWALLQHYQEKGLSKKFNNSYLGSSATLVELESGDTRELPFVRQASFDSTSTWLVYSVADTAGRENGLYKIDLKDENPRPEKITGERNSLYSNLSWNHSEGLLAFTEAVIDTSRENLPGDAAIYTWNVAGGEPEQLVSPNEPEDQYRLRTTNRLTWTKDGKRLFFRLMEDEMVAIDEARTAEEDSLTAGNLYDTSRILNDIEGVVWHTDDPLIKPHEKKQWNNRKNHLHTAVYHFEEEHWVMLTDEDMPDVYFSHNPNVVIGRNSEPYAKELTWDGRYTDYYTVDLSTGERTKLLEKSRFRPVVSPGGKWITWFDGENRHLLQVESGTARNITGGLGVPFADEDNDRPQPSGSYGIAGWTENDSDILFYDKYDIWQVNTDTGSATNITDGTGRDENRIFRIRNLNPDRETFKENEKLILSMRHDQKKHTGIYEARIGRQGVKRLIEEDRKYTILRKAENSDEILFTRQTYREYPNIWVANNQNFRKVKQISDLHENLTDTYAWGHAELIEWTNMDGRTVQGVLIYPGNYDPDKKYPVLTYYYERYSQRLYDFNKPVTNHRPNFAQYTSDGYAVFLPDVWFDVPIPGYSATKNLVPGVQKLVDMGVADPNGLGLHGHSWSGYLTAHVVTQTDVFSAAVAGAPVSNMTSAYGGIRWASGRARQFQYEKTQSRLGVSLWENPNPYIENSPLFYADRINTPLMLQHGDADGAVPWYQSIELYLALRRLGKDSVFLQYYDEPHHLQKFANKLDYSIKMKEYFDHYLKGEPAAAWITDGVPYRGN